MEPDDVLSSLAAVAADLGPALQPPGYEALLQDIAGAVRGLLQAEACSIAAFDRRTEELEFVAASGAGEERIVGRRMSGGHGIAGWVLASGQSITVKDVTKDPRFAEDVASSTGYVPSSLIAAPLQAGADVVGVLEVLDPAEHSSDERLEEVLGILTRQAALAIEASQVFEDLGATLMRAAGSAAAQQEKGEALGQALADAATRARGPARELGNLAAIFYELALLGPEERAAAVKVLSAFLGYASSREPGA
jgi:GAF domain-containing protein